MNAITSNRLARQELMETKTPPQLCHKSGTEHQCHHRETMLWSTEIRDSHISDIDLADDLCTHIRIVSVVIANPASRTLLASHRRAFVAWASGAFFMFGVLGETSGDLVQLHN